MTKPLTGRVAVVTGGANGIGRATVERLAKEGADVAIMDLEEAAMKEVTEEVKRQGVRVLPVAVNMMDRKAVVDAFARVKKELGVVDILVNNVGQSARGRATEFYQSPDDLWDFIIDLNLKSAMLCTRQVLPDMRERKRGKIVCLSSESAFNGSLKMAEYGAAKAGVIGFIRTVAAEVAPFGITVNAVCPGLTRTRAYDLLPPDMVKSIQATLPFGRPAEPREMANVIYFLCSDDSSYVSGHAIVANGAHGFN